MKISKWNLTLQTKKASWETEKIRFSIVFYVYRVSNIVETVLVTMRNIDFPIRNSEVNGSQTCKWKSNSAEKMLCEVKFDVETDFDSFESWELRLSYDNLCWSPNIRELSEKLYLYLNDIRRNFSYLYVENDEESDFSSLTTRFFGFEIQNTFWKFEKWF